jgi:membrane associated rhomboid family serine protease
MHDPLSTRREPMVRVPWAVFALVALLIALHAWRVLAHVDAAPLAFSSADIAQGRWLPLITHMFVHGSWAHVLMNAAFCLVFGAPVSRLLGRSLWGGVLFLLLFLVCGVAAALGYAALYPHGPWMLVGASGAASGLMGGASRLLDGTGRPSPLVSRPVFAMSLGWIVVNAVLGLSGLTPGAAGVAVAWQAHIIGFFVGLLLISPFAWAAGVRREPPPLAA